VNKRETSKLVQRSARVAWR